MEYRHEWKHEINYTDFVNQLAMLPGVNSAVLVSYNGEYLS